MSMYFIQDIEDNVADTIEYENTFIVDGIENRIIKEYRHPNCGIYAVEVEDAQNRHWIVPPEDIEEPEFMVDGMPVDVLQIYQQDGIVGYLIQFPDGRKLPVDCINTRPMIVEEDFRYETFDWDSIPF